MKKKDCTSIFFHQNFSDTGRRGSGNRIKDDFGFPGRRGSGNSEFFSQKLIKQPLFLNIIFIPTT